MDFRTLTSWIRRRNNLARLISMVLALILFVLLVKTETIHFHPYRANMLPENEFMQRGQYYLDLNADQKSEQLIFRSYSEKPVVEIFADNDSFLDVIRLHGDGLDEGVSFFSGDTDQDGFTELYLLSVSNDSVLLNGYEPLGDQLHFLRNLYISAYPEISDRNNLHLIDARCVQLAGEEGLNLQFLIRAGYALSPRMIVQVDPWTQEIRKSFKSAAGYNSTTVFLDESGNVEQVVAGANALENYQADDSVLFNDNSGWMISYSPYLQDTLLAIEFPRNKCFVYPILRREQQGDFYYLLLMEMAAGTSRLIKMDTTGRRVNEILLGEGLRRYRLMNMLLPGLEEIVVKFNGSLMFYNEELKLLRTEPGAGHMIGRESWFTREQIKKTMLIPFISNNKLEFRDPELNLLSRTNIENTGLMYTDRFMLKSAVDPENMVIAFKSKQEILHFSFNKNKIYVFRGYLYLAVFLVIYYFFFLLFRLQNYYYDRRNQARQRITALQLQSIQNQLQPHFTFNVLNTIGSMIYKDNKEKAYEYLNYFSDMLRSTLLSRSGSEWQIGEELNFIDTYMEMENLRFDNRFAYSRKIGEGVDLMLLVPKMLIQSFAENSIRHGLMHKKGFCRLMVILEGEQAHVKCVVEDNGIGRDAASKLQRESGGMGNLILQEYLAVYNKLHKVKFDLYIEDLKDPEGEASGTRVTLMIPRDYTVETK